MDTPSLVECLEMLAPPALAESWDNTGLLVDPGDGVDHQKVGLTIELTEATWKSAVASGATFLVVYHPPIFAGLKKLGSDPLSSLVVRALRAGITIYSPHTSLDAAREGMGDWLAGALGAGASKPIVPTLADPSLGAGRLVVLDEPVPFDKAVERVKAHLALPHLRVARASLESPIRTLAVCPGAGGSLFEKVGNVDLLLTGEMRHHDVAGRVKLGTHVFLTEHTNSERGYLPIFRARLSALAPSLSVILLNGDADPLTIL